MIQVGLLIDERRGNEKRRVSGGEKREKSFPSLKSAGEVPHVFFKSKALVRQFYAPRDSARDDLDRRISSTSGAWNHGSQSSAYGLKKAYVSQGSLDPIWGRQGRGVCGESKKLMSTW